jgi:O-antigen/teichoic acid export membrane protein
MHGLGDLLRKAGHYSLANLAIMAAGLISFPILTRVLSVSEYGIMGLNVMLLTWLGSLSKLGLQHSAVRLWSEWERRPGGMQRFTLTFFLGALLTSLPVLALYAGALWLLRPWIGDRLFGFFLLASPLLFIQALSSFGTNLLRARQWSGRRAVFDVASGYAAMVLAVLGATVIWGGLRGYYLGLMSGQALVALVLLASVLSWTRLRRGNFSPSLLREGISYGLPMAVAELSGSLFHMSDRLVIQWLLDENAVGYFTMAFNLAMYVNTLFALPMDLAAVPMMASLYEQAGARATSEFLRKAARFFFMAAAPVAVGMWVIREDLVALLASRRFLPGAALVHLLLVGFMLHGGRTLLGAGLLLKKRVWTVAAIELAGAATNLALNLLLIPRMGIAGSALATLVTQLAATLVVFWWGSRLVPVRLEGLALLGHAGWALLMGVVVSRVSIAGGTAVRLLVHVAAGALVYLLLLLLVDPEARRLARRALGKP